MHKVSLYTRTALGTADEKLTVTKYDPCSTYTYRLVGIGLLGGVSDDTAFIGIGDILPDCCG